jgi:hypothetical protein
MFVSSIRRAGHSVDPPCATNFAVSETPQFGRCTLHGLVLQDYQCL